MLTVVLSGKKMLRIQKYAAACGRGVSQFLPHNGEKLFLSTVTFANRD